MEALGLFGLLLLLFASKQPRGAGGAPPPSSQQLPAGWQTTSTSPPWPQVVPSGLPAFPGSGWQYDEPPPAAVVQRAGQLVNQLWQGGAGTYKVEQTGGRWIAYRAEVMRSGKKGVAAYRLAGAKLPAGKNTAALPPAAAPAATPAAAPAQRPAASPANPIPAQLPPDARILPTLRKGIGVKPQQPNANVRLMQARLNAAGAQSVVLADGAFGPKTETALKAFQTRVGLDADGVCGPKTWTQLLTDRA